MSLWNALQLYDYSCWQGWYYAAWTVLYFLKEVAVFVATEIFYNNLISAMTVGVIVLVCYCLSHQEK